MFAKDSQEFKFLRSLNTPEKIQTFLDEMPLNHETEGETSMSPLRVLREQKSHCIEGAFLAGVCLAIQGEKPLIVSLKVMKDDIDHIITLFKRNGYYGAISKTNHVVLRYRDPVYRTVRELAMSYFHEYYLTKNGKKTLIGYTNPINLNRFGTKWITAEEDLWNIAEKIYDTPVIATVSKENKKYLRPASVFEQKVARIQEWEEQK
jgi:hypothetical protein